MTILLCSANETVRTRWDTILSPRYPILHLDSLNSLLKSPAAGRTDGLALIHMSDSTREEARQLGDISIAAKVFFFSDRPRDVEGIALLKQGAVGYANTYISPARLEEAVNVVLSGRIWVGQALMQRLISASAPMTRETTNLPPGAIIEELSPRERQIALLISQGFSNQAIAEQLYISERTVKSHLGSIFSKTGIQSRLQLALLMHGHQA